MHIIRMRVYIETIVPKLQHSQKQSATKCNMPRGARAVSPVCVSRPYCHAPPTKKKTPNQTPHRYTHLQNRRRLVADAGHHDRRRRRIRCGEERLAHVTRRRRRRHRDDIVVRFARHFRRRRRQRIADACGNTGVDRLQAAASVECMGSFVFV